MRLDPLRIVCVRPAPKSRSAVSGPSAYEDQDQKRCADQRLPGWSRSYWLRALLVGLALAGKRLMW